MILNSSTIAAIRDHEPMNRQWLVQFPGLMAVLPDVNLAFIDNYFFIEDRPATNKDFRPAADIAEIETVRMNGRDRHSVRDWPQVESRMHDAWVMSGHRVSVHKALFFRRDQPIHGTSN